MVSSTPSERRDGSVSREAMLGRDNRADTVPWPTSLTPTNEESAWLAEENLFLG